MAARSLAAVALLALALSAPLAAATCPSNFRWACDQCDAFPLISKIDCNSCVATSASKGLNVEWACVSCGSGLSGVACRACSLATGTNNVNACQSCLSLPFVAAADCLGCVVKVGPLGTGVAYSCATCGTSNRCRTCLETNPNKAWACQQCVGDANYDACVFCKGQDYEKCYRCKTTSNNFATCMAA